MPAIFLVSTQKQTIAGLARSYTILISLCRVR
jgi:hypothetical protein